MIRSYRQPIRKLHLEYGTGVTDLKKLRECSQYIITIGSIKIKRTFLDVPEIILAYVVVLEDWEIAPNNLKLLDKKLGEGQFGIVKQGLLKTGKGDSEVIAVKTLKGTELTSLFTNKLFKLAIILWSCYAN